MEHSLRYVANCSILFTEIPLLQRPAAAATAGFDAVEFWWPFPAAVPSDADVATFVAAIEGAGVALVALNFPGGDRSAGDRGLVSWPGRSAEFLDGVDIAVGIADRLGTTGFNALYGNRIGGVSPQEQDELAVTNLLAATGAAARVGATVLLEPMSGAPRYPLRTADDVVAVIERVAGAGGGGDRLRLLADLYHLAVNGDDLDAAIARHGARIGHVQIADVPGRHEPGTGDLDLDRHLLELQSGGYVGYVGLEYVPTTGTEASLRWLPTARRATRRASTIPRQPDPGPS